MSHVDVRDISQDWGRRLLAELARENVRATISQRLRSSQVLTFRIALWRARDLDRVQTPKMLRRLAHVIGRDGDVRMSTAGGCLLVEVGLPASYHQPLLLAGLRRGRGCQVPVGRDLAGDAVYIDLSSPDTPHAAVAGTTGSGKSVLLQVMAAGLVRQNTPDEMRLVLIDGKGDAGHGLMPLAGVSHLSHPVINDPREGAAALTWLVSTMERRSAGWSQRIVCIIDEVQLILDETGGVRGSAAQAIVRLTEMGRSRGISLVLATQHPVADVLGGSLAKANLPLRLVGKVTDAAASTNATGQAGAEAHRLRGRGDWLMVQGGDVRRFQVAYPRDEDLASLPRGETLPEAGEMIEALDHAIADAPALSRGETTHPSQVPTPIDGAELDWAMANGQFIGGRTMAAGVVAIKRRFSVGTKRAERIRDLAQDTLDAAHERMVATQATHPSHARRPALRVVGGPAEPWDTWDGEDTDA